MNNITADQIQQGDLIKVTTTENFEHRKVTYSYEGVAAKQNGEVWRTEDGGNLWVHERGAVIELLDRPKPKVLVPTLPNAVVTYMHGWKSGPYSAELEKRTAVRDSSKEGGWIAYDDNGMRMNGFNSDEYFSRCLTERDSMQDLKVLFAGVAK